MTRALLLLALALSACDQEPAPIPEQQAADGIETEPEASVAHVYVVTSCYDAYSDAEGKYVIARLANKSDTFEGRSSCTGGSWASVQIDVDVPGDYLVYIHDAQYPCEMTVTEADIDNGKSLDSCFG